jgi:hypothetical protein
MAIGIPLLVIGFYVGLSIGGEKGARTRALQNEFLREKTFREPIA